MTDLVRLPGYALVRKGLEDLRGRRETVESLLVSMGASRIRRCGVDVPAEIDDPEPRLYRLLSAEFGDAAHSRYNSLLRELVSFERALECAS